MAEICDVHQPIEPRRDLTFDQLRSEGLLWLINRQVFHPRGYALGVSYDENGAGKGFALLGDGREPWNFVDGEESELLAACNRALAPCLTLSCETLGSEVIGDGA